MIGKKHITPDGKLILAICDSELKGKNLVQEDKQLDLSSNFYDGEEMDSKRISELFKVAYIVNLAGEESVSLGIREGVIDKENIITICNVPHAQAVIIRE